MKRLHSIGWVLFISIGMGLIGLALTAEQVTAAPPLQTDDTGGDEPVADQPTEDPPQQDCQSCHLDVAAHWDDSPHAHAYDDPTFQAQWASLGQPDQCLACHTTNFIRSTGEYEEAGITCQACHALPEGEHPPAPVPVLADTEYCGKCHTTTLGEWRLTGHAEADVGCSSCHDPHSQEILFEKPDDVCTNCHELEALAEAEHPQVLDNLDTISCVGCHTLITPHPFQQNYQDMSMFAKGFDCQSTAANLAQDHQFVLGLETLDKETRPWPIVHAVTPADYSLECRTCHDPAEGQLDFAAFDYSEERIVELTWDEYPTITTEQSDQLVATATDGRGWIGWLASFIGIFVVAEFAVTRRMKDE